MESRIDAMRHAQKTLTVQAKEKTTRNDGLKHRLLELKKGQERVVERLESVRTEKGRLTRILEERTEKSLAVRQESEKLRPYVAQSPAALQSSLSDLSDTLTNSKTTIDALERRTRALHTSTETFTVLTHDVAACGKLLEDVSAELRLEDEESLTAARHRDALAERGNNVREVERTEALLRRQLGRWVDRTDGLRKVARERAEGDRARVEELRGVHRGLVEERGGRGREMERRRVGIEQVEKKVCFSFPFSFFCLLGGTGAWSVGES